MTSTLSKIFTLDRLKPYNSRMVFGYPDDKTEWSIHLQKNEALYQGALSKSYGAREIYGYHHDRRKESVPLVQFLYEEKGKPNYFQYNSQGEVTAYTTFRYHSVENGKGLNIGNDTYIMHYPEQEKQMHLTYKDGRCIEAKEITPECETVFIAYSPYFLKVDRVTTNYNNGDVEEVRYKSNIGSCDSYHNEMTSYKIGFSKYTFKDTGNIQIAMYADRGKKNGLSLLYAANGDFISAECFLNDKKLDDIIVPENQKESLRYDSTQDIVANNKYDDSDEVSLFNAMSWMFDHNAAMFNPKNSMAVMYKIFDLGKYQGRTRRGPGVYF